MQWIHTLSPFGPLSPGWPRDPAGPGAPAAPEGPPGPRGPLSPCKTKQLLDPERIEKSNTSIPEMVKQE